MGTHFTEHGKLNKFFNEYKQNKADACRKYFVNEENILSIVGLDITALAFIPDDFKSLELYRKASELSPYTYLFLPKKYKEDAVILMNCLKRDGHLLRYCPESVKRNKQYVRVAIRCDAYAVKYADAELLKNKDFCKEIISWKPMAIKYFSSFWEDKDIMYPLCRYYKEYIKYLSPEMQAQVEELYYSDEPLNAVHKLFPSEKDKSWDEEVARIAATSKFGCMFTYEEKGGKKLWDTEC